MMSIFFLPTHHFQKDIPELMYWNYSNTTKHPKIWYCQAKENSLNVYHAWSLAPQYPRLIFHVPLLENTDGVRFQSFPMPFQQSSSCIDKQFIAKYGKFRIALASLQQHNINHLLYEGILEQQKLATIHVADSDCLHSPSRSLEVYRWNIVVKNTAPIWKTSNSEYPTNRLPLVIFDGAFQQWF